MKTFSFYSPLCCLLFLLINSNLIGQELPPIQKFTPIDYNGENQNWMISQGSNKSIYVGNNEGLLEYNGAKWKMYRSPNNTIIRAVKAVGKRIYTGCYMEFGFWERDVFGGLNYKSVVSKFKKPMVEDEHIWNIVTNDEWILFQSFNRIYFYNSKTGSTKIINSKNGISRIFNVNGFIYYHVEREGIYKFEGGQPRLIIDNTVFKNDKIVGMFHITNGLLVLTRSSGFYKLIEGKLTSWNFPGNEILRKMNIFNSIQLRDKSFVIGTIKNGVIFLDVNGNIKLELNRNNGLSNNTALGLFEDVDNNVWVGLDNGINCVNLKAPIRVFNDDEGEIGTIYASIVHNNILYLGTNQGLFYKRAFTQDSFKFVNGTSGQVWCLFKYKDDLLCGHHSGTFVINNDKANLISAIPGTWEFKTVSKTEDILLQGNYNGLNVLIKEDGIWKIRNKIKGFDNSARYFEIGENNELWVSHGYKGLFRLKIDEGLTMVKNVSIDSKTPFDKNSSLIKYNNRILYANKGGILGFDSVKNEFVRDKVLSSLVDQSAYASGKLVVDETGKLWVFTKENISYVELNDLTNDLKINKVAISYSLRKGQVGYENISHLQNNNYLIGITDGYLILDISRINQSNTYQIELNSVTLNSVDQEKIKIDMQKSGDFDYSNNSITFSYSVPIYDKYKEVKYQFRLKGRYNDWSEWNTKSELVFENLSFGDYTLNIRAKVGDKLSNNTINYQFRIARPWFLSNIAIFFYLLIVLGFSLILHKSYKKHYKKVHERKQLENEQLITKIKNDQLYQDIESKNRELAISTMSIIKKNEVLNSIQKELKRNRGTDNDATLKLIDNNLNDSQDWSFFEKAFNNADKGFLDKIKQSHPDLSPNDLRFCAYLRLNLSSKEIAPLLNISIKSVETKRYRLRKKLGLDHDNGLVTYILNF